MSSNSNSNAKLFVAAETMRAYKIASINGFNEEAVALLAKVPAAAYWRQIIPQLCLEAVGDEEIGKVIFGRVLKTVSLRNLLTMSNTPHSSHVFSVVLLSQAKRST